MERQAIRALINNIHSPLCFKLLNWHPRVKGKVKLGLRKQTEEESLGVGFNNVQMNPRAGCSASALSFVCSLQTEER